MKGSQHLEQAGRAGAGDQVAQVGLERADGQGLVPTTAHFGESANLDSVADGGARGVTFHQRNLRRQEFSRGVGRAQGSHLALLRGDQQAAATAVVAQADAANHAQDVISVAAGVFQAS